MKPRIGRKAIAKCIYITGLGKQAHRLVIIPPATGWWGYLETLRNALSGIGFPDMATGNAVVRALREEAYKRCNAPERQ